MQFKNKGYQIKRKSICIVCGLQDHNKLTKHHIIGSCYSSKLKSEIKNELRKIHWYYFEWDYCCLCKKCHEKYEKDFSDILHQLIWKKYGIDLLETSHQNLKNYYEGKPSPSQLVMSQINTPEDYLELRNFCIKFFIDNMSPIYPII